MAALAQRRPLHSWRAVVVSLSTAVCLVFSSRCFSTLAFSDAPRFAYRLPLHFPTMSSQEPSRHAQPSSSSPDSYSVGLGSALLSFASQSSDSSPQSYANSFASKQSQWASGGATGNGSGNGSGSEWSRPQAASAASASRGNTGTGWGAFSSAQGGRATWNGAPSHSDKQPTQQQHDSSQSTAHHIDATGSSNGSGVELNGSHSEYDAMLNSDSAAVSHSHASTVDYSHSQPQQLNGGWDAHSHTSDASSAWSSAHRAGAAAAASWDNSTASSASSHSDSPADAWKQKSAPSSAPAPYSRSLAASTSAAPSVTSSNSSPPSSYRPADFGDLYLDPSRPTIWCYKDPQGEIQGPFDEHSMRAWYNNRFFDLKVSPASTHNKARACRLC